MTYHALDSGRIKQVTIIDTIAIQSSFHLLKIYFQIHMYALELQVQGTNAQAGQFDSLQQCIMQRKHHLHHGL